MTDDDIDSILAALDRSLDEPPDVVAYDVGGGVALELHLDGGELIGSAWRLGSWWWLVPVGEA